MSYRLGLDLGANSVGWCAVTLDAEREPCALLDLGVRVYPDGRDRQDYTSLASQRRGPRSMRRNRDRYLQRRQNLLNALTRAGLMPAGDAERQAIARLDPYTLRAHALHCALLPQELGRVLFHINQHRGFKSNRKTDRGNKEGGLISEAARETAALLHRTGHATIGSLLAERHREHKPVRVRLAGSGKTARYELYPQRAMVEHEFDTIWAAQSAWNPALTPALGAELRNIIFFQRDLRPPVVGKCWLEPEQERAPRALPTAQRFRIAQTVTHLRISQPGMPERALSDKERDILLSLLYRGSDQKLETLPKKLGLAPETDFNCRDDKLVGCAVATRLGAKTCLGASWHEMSLAQQDSVIRALLDAESDASAILALEALGLTRQMAERAADTSLPDGHAALSALALGKILPCMEVGQTYDKAVQSAGYRHHSDRRTGEIRERLPYYGEVLYQRIGTGTGEPCDNEEKRLGKAPNPTVHVALNEIRRVVNAIIETHGAPAEIVVETLRELGRSAKQRKEYEAEQKKNRTANDTRRAEILSLGFKVNATNLMRLRLLEEQANDPKQGCCPYTGKFISPRMALSDEVEADHILPFKDTLDDSAANRVLVMRDANRSKAKRTPYHAFSHTAEWPAILSRVALLPDNKKWRFAPDALEKFAKDGDFLARHLTDSATIARWAVEYLGIIAPEKVRAVPGRLTSLLRHGLGLNSRSVLGKGGAHKDRTDHRHHAIDAVVVALTDRATLQRVTRAAQAADTTGERLTLKIEPPWEGFVADVAARLASVTVSYKPDTGWQGALHNDTSYGLIQASGGNGHNAVTRQTLDKVAEWKPRRIAKTEVRDPVLARQIAKILGSTAEVSERRKMFSNVTDSRGHPVRSVRTTERLDMHLIRSRQTGLPYRGVKLDSNHRFEVWRHPDGSLIQFIVSTFDAAQAAEAARLGRPVPEADRHPAAKRLLRLHKNDMVAFGNGDARRIFVVVKMSDDKVFLAEHQEAGRLKARNEDKSDPFKYVSASVTKLRAEQARKIHVRPDGRIFDPGPVL
jgi:CRISPR-associated endonuclease Csn1